LPRLDAVALVSNRDRPEVETGFSAPLEIRQTLAIRAHRPRRLRDTRRRQRHRIVGRGGLDDPEAGCDYGLVGSGVRGLEPAGSESFATVSMVTYDGQGGFTALGVSHGQLTGVRAGLPVSGTYYVNTCWFTACGLG
jgi:hypothetical protein